MPCSASQCSWLLPGEGGIGGRQQLLWKSERADPSLTNSRTSGALRCHSVVCVGSYVRPPQQRMSRRNGEYPMVELGFSHVFRFRALLGAQLSIHVDLADGMR